MSDGQSITVLGAGIAGLAVAQLLARFGRAVTVLEQASEIREVGAGLQISPNGTRVLRAMGLGGGLDAASDRAGAVVLADGQSGAAITRLDLLGLRTADDYRLMHRADLIALLAEGARAAGVDIRLDRKVTDIALGNHPPRVTLANGEMVEAGLLVGADGLHSRMRTALNGEAVPFFTHHSAWRATIPAEPGAAPVVQVFLGPGKHLVSYPLRGGRLRNIVAVEERRRWVEESWSLTDDPMTLRVAFEDFAPEVRGWLDQVDRPNLWGLFRHPVAKTWWGKSAVILGDAAHPTLPFLAQGANLALEDAWVLADALSRYPQAEALARYQSRREGRARRVIEAANANARNFHLSGLSRAVAHLGLRSLGAVAPSLLLSRFDWLYGHDVTAG
ncbi:MAG: FAD-dependent monooxygenase [Rhodobacteraceae bacterium]|nr:FAD-dependent monooxygenase [Paracoccaceae bacterium]